VLETIKPAHTLEELAEIVAVIEGILRVVILLKEFKEETGDGVA
jgi:hypothetical protein